MNYIDSKTLPVPLYTKAFVSRNYCSNQEIYLMGATIKNQIKFVSFNLINKLTACNICRYIDTYINKLPRIDNLNI